MEIEPVAARITRLGSSKEKPLGCTRVFSYGASIGTLVL